MRTHLKAIVLLGLAGLLSAAVTIAFFEITQFVAGALLGALAAICLQKLRILNDRQAGWLVAVSTIAYSLSFVLVFWLEAGAPTPLVYGPNPDRGSPVALLLGGALGALVLVGGTLWLVRWKLSSDAISAWAVCGAGLGAFMAFVGWSLGPSLGNAVMDLLYATPLPTSNAPEYQTWYALFIVWETALGLFLGLILGRHQDAPRTTEA